MKLLRLLLPLFTFLLISCGEEPQQVSINIVLEEPIATEKYPSYFNDLVVPFSTSCEKDILLKPINVVRSDIKKSGKELNAWYFESFGDNTVEFSKNWLSFYFKDSLVDPYLKQKSNDRSFNQDNYLKEGKNTYIFSEESEVDDYEGYTVYSSAKDLHKAIQQDACNFKNPEVNVLVNPSFLTTIKTDTTKLVDPTTGTSENPCKQASVPEAFKLLGQIDQIIDVNNNSTKRFKIAEQLWKEHFDPNAYVALYVSASDTNPEIWEPGDGEGFFTNHLALINSINSVAIFEADFNTQTGKFSSIKVIECRNTSSVL